MVSMKTSEPLVESQGENPYGYGLRICLDAAQCKALGLSNPLPIGATVDVTAKAVVVRAEQEIEPDEADDAPETRMSLQITDLELRRTGGRDVAARLYDSEEGGEGGA